MMSVIAILATIFGLISGLANVPQIIKIFKTKSAKDLSLITQTIFLVMSVVWLIYGFNIHDLPLILSNVLYVITYSIIVIGYILYGKGKKKK